MLHNLFPTAVFSFTFEEANQNKQNYLDYLYKLKQEDPGKARSNIHSWHSSNTKHPLKDHVFSSLNTFIHDSAKLAIDKMGYTKIEMEQKESWCIISPKGAYNVPHLHPGAFISGSYYIDAPTEPIIFYDPRPIREFTESISMGRGTIYTATTIAMMPKEGELLLFPSWLKHSVPENKSEKERVIISFNFYFC